jgi:hypothetical protein
MMPSVNLLPQAYRRAQVRRRRFRMGLAIGAGLLGMELFAGFILHTRAGRTRELLDAAQTAKSATVLVKKKMETPAAESKLLGQQLALARKLRTTHAWSRLLGQLAAAASPRVTLTAVTTDPARWTAGLDADVAVGATPKSGASNTAMLTGLTVRGYAGDYEELAEFVKGVQAANAFASLSLREARRDKYLEQDVVSFELQCRW